MKMDSDSIDEALLYIEKALDSITKSSNNISSAKYSTDSRITGYHIVQSDLDSAITNCKIIINKCNDFLDETKQAFRALSGKPISEAVSTLSAMTGKKPNEFSNDDILSMGKGPLDRNFIEDPEGYMAKLNRKRKTEELLKKGYTKKDIDRVLDGEITIEELFNEIMCDENKDRYRSVVESSYLQQFNYSGSECKAKLDELKSEKEELDKKIEALDYLLSDHDHIGYSLEEKSKARKEKKELEAKKNKIEREIIDLTQKINIYGDLEINFDTMDEITDAISEYDTKINELTEEISDLSSYEHYSESFNYLIGLLISGQSYNEAKNMVVAYKYQDENGDIQYDYRSDYDVVKNDSKYNDKDIIFKPVSFDEMYGDFPEVDQLLMDALDFRNGDYYVNQEDTSPLFEIMNESNVSKKLQPLKEEATRLIKEREIYQSIVDNIKVSIDYQLDYIIPYITKDGFKEESTFKGDIELLDNISYINELYDKYCNSMYDDPTLSNEEIKSNYDEYAGLILSCILNGSTDVSDDNYVSDGYANGVPYPDIALFGITSNYKENAINYCQKWRKVMDENELAAFNYICNTEGYAKGYEYLVSISKTLDKRYVQNERSKDTEYAHEHPFLSSLGSIFKKPLEGLHGAIYSLGCIIADTPIRMSNTYSSSDTWRNTVATDIGALQGDFASFVYTSGMSIADSGLVITLTSITGGGSLLFSTGVMGSSVYLSTLNEALERNIDDKKAVILALGCAAIESIMESYSVGHLIGLEKEFNEVLQNGVVMKKIIDKLSSKGINSEFATKMLAFAYSMFDQSLVEADEEFWTEIADYLWDTVVAGDLSKREVSLKKYKKEHPGCSETDAYLYEFGNLMNDSLQAGAGGFFSGTFFGVGTGGRAAKYTTSFTTSYNQFLNQQLARIQMELCGDLYNQQENNNSVDTNVVVEEVSPLATEEDTQGNFYNKDEIIEFSIDKMMALKEMSEYFGDPGSAINLLLINSGKTAMEILETLSGQEKADFERYLNDTESGRWLKTLTADEIDAINRRTLMSGNISYFEKNGNADLDMQKRIDGIDSAIQKYGGIKKDIKLYRGVTLPGFIDQFSDNVVAEALENVDVNNPDEVLNAIRSLVGINLNTAINMPTSPGYHQAFFSNIRMEIIAREGVDGAYVNVMSSRYNEENEFLLGRNQNLVIKDVEIRNEQVWVICEMTSPTNDIHEETTETAMDEVLDERNDSSNQVNNVRTLEELCPLLQDENYFILGHGTGRSSGNVVDSIFQNGLRASHGSIMYTTIGLNANNMETLEDNLNNWPHLNSNEIILIRLPIEYINMIGDANDLDGERFGAFYNERLIEGTDGQIVNYLDPKFIIGVYNSDTHTVRMNENFEETLSEETIGDLKIKYDKAVKKSEERLKRQEEAFTRFGNSNESNIVSADTIEEYNFDDFNDDNIIWDSLDDGLVQTNENDSKADAIENNDISPIEGTVFGDEVINESEVSKEDSSIVPESVNKNDVIISKLTDLGLSIEEAKTVLDEDYLRFETEEELNQGIQTLFAPNKYNDIIQLLGDGYTLDEMVDNNEVSKEKVEQFKAIIEENNLDIDSVIAFNKYTIGSNMILAAKRGVERSTIIESIHNELISRLSEYGFSREQISEIGEYVNSLDYPKPLHENYSLVRNFLSKYNISKKYIAAIQTAVRDLNSCYNLNKTVADLDNGLQQTLSTPMVLYRAVDSEYMKSTYGDDLKNLIGQSISIDGYLSTSPLYDSSFAKYSDYDVVYEIYAPEGTKGVLVSPYSSYGNTENEVLLNATNLVITDVIENFVDKNGNNKIIIKAIAVNDSISTQKNEIINEYSKSEFMDFLENDTTGEILQLLNDDGCSILQNSKLKEERIEYILAHSKYKNELFNNKAFLEIFLNSDVSNYYGVMNGLSFETCDKILNECANKNKNSEFKKLFSYFSKEYKLKALDNWAYSTDLLYEAFKTYDQEVMTKILENYDIDLLSHDIDLRMLFERGKYSVLKAQERRYKNGSTVFGMTIPVDKITTQMAQKIWESYDLFNARSIINDANYSTDASVINDYIKKQEENILNFAIKNGLTEQFLSIYEAYSELSTLDKNSDEYYEKHHEVRMLINDVGYTGLFNELEEQYKSGGIESVQKYIQTLNNNSLSNYIIDYHFEENYYNVMFDIKELLNFYYSGNVNIPLDRILLYQKIANIDSLSIEEMSDLHEELKKQDIMGQFYDDMELSRRIVGEAIKNYSLDAKTIKKYRNEELSQKYGVDVYTIDNNPFFAIVKTGRHDADSLPVGHSYSLIGYGGIAVYGDVEKSDTYVYDSSSLNSQQLVHVFPYDSFTLYRPFEHSEKGSNSVNVLMMPDELMANTKNYNELLILERGKNELGIEESIPELQKMALYCIDNITEESIETAKKQGVGIFLVDSKNYYKPETKPSNIYRHDISNFNYTYYDVLSKEKLEKMRRMEQTENSGLIDVSVKIKQIFGIKSDVSLRYNSISNQLILLNSEGMIIDSISNFGKSNAEISNKISRFLYKNDVINTNMYLEQVLKNGLYNFFGDEITKQKIINILRSLDLSNISKEDIFKYSTEEGFDYRGFLNYGLSNDKFNARDKEKLKDIINEIT